MVTRQNVMIKGTKDGLILHLNDKSSFEKVLEELKDKLLPHQNVFEEIHTISVRIHTGNRYLSEEQEKIVREIISQHKNLKLEAVISNVITIEEAENLKKESEIQMAVRIVRSGQVLQVPGDILLVGDVNPGGKIEAGGNIFILGSLKGIAHAGVLGNEEAVICASHMKPTQLRIADYITRAPDRDTSNNTESECAYVNSSKQIIIDRLIALKKIRPNLNRFVEEDYNRG